MQRSFPGIVQAAAILAVVLLCGSQQCAVRAEQNCQALPLSEDAKPYTIPDIAAESCLPAPPPCGLESLSFGAVGANCCEPPQDPGLIFYAEYLGWKVRHQGLDFATFVHPATPPALNTPIATESLDFPRRSGIRAGLGYHFATGWDLTWHYTNYFTRDRRSVAALGMQTGLVAPRSFFDTQLMDEIQAEGSLRFDVHDLEAAWLFRFDTVGFRIFGSIRWATIEEQLNTFYSYRLPFGGVQVNGAISQPSGINGGGIRFGGELQWTTTNGLRLFVRGAQSLLMTDFQMRQQEVDSAHGLILDYSQNSPQVVPVLEAALGIAWRRGPLEVSACYETNIWGGIIKTNNELQSLLLDGFSVRLAYVH